MFIIIFIISIIIFIISIIIIMIMCYYILLSVIVIIIIDYYYRLLCIIIIITIIIINRDRTPLAFSYLGGGKANTTTTREGRCLFVCSKMNLIAIVDDECLLFEIDL